MGDLSCAMPSRRLLADGWQLSSCRPGEAADPAAALALAWRAVAGCGPVAALEAAAGRWSLDQPPLPLDSCDWWYRLDFGLDATQVAQSPVLGFDGLATLAQVWLNGTLLLQSDNMFVAHECPVAGLLQSGANQLLIRFASLDAALAARRPRPRWRVPMLANQQLRWFRTTLLGRTPGWSPPCPVVGPWRDVWLGHGQHAGPRVTRVAASVSGSTGQVDLALSVPAAGGDASPVQSVRLTLQRNGRTHDADLVRSQAGTITGPDAGAAGESAHDSWSVRLIIDNVTLWWPNSHGDAALYDARLALTYADGSRRQLPLSPVGFRHLQVDTADGGFAVSVNGVPVFCRGACWAPLDVLRLHGRPQDYRAVLARVRDAGMNMLRVPGTLVYEHDAFHDACDEFGVLVWQDLMFANMDYPADDAGFAASVGQELAQQLPRLSGHASLAVVCGNSEVSQQAAMWGAPRPAWAPMLFLQTLPALVQRHLPGTPWWPSSAWGGSFPHQVDAGTTSYYGVGAYRRPLDDARRSGLRFATECLAFAHPPGAPAQARMPGGAALRVTHPGWKARTPRDLGAGWDFEDVRDVYLARLFGVDPLTLRATDHDRYLRLSAAAAGAAMQQAFAEWRRQDSGCRGALVLMLRDLWAGAGWGLLDDTGLPKPCWPMLARVLQPVTVLLTDEGSSGLFAQLINESARPLDAQLELLVCRGATVLARAGRPVQLAARATRALPLVDLLDHFMDLNDAYGFGPLAHDAVVVTLQAADGSRLAQAFHFPRGPVLPGDPALGLTAQASAQPDGSMLVDVGSDHLATLVSFDTPGYAPDDEFFHLAPGQRHQVRFRPTGKVPAHWRALVMAANGTAPVVIPQRAAGATT